MASAQAPDRRLIASSRSLFARKGFDGTSLREISRIAGLTFGSVVYHFGSKRALYEAAVADCACPFEARAQSAAEGEGSPGERLLSAARALTVHVREHPDVPALLLQEVAVGRRPPAPVECVLGKLMDLLSGLAEEAESLAEAGTDPEAVARAVLYQVLGGRLVERALDGDARGTHMGQAAGSRAADGFLFLKLALAGVGEDA